MNIIRIQGDCMYVLILSVLISIFTSCESRKYSTPPHPRSNFSKFTILDYQKGAYQFVNDTEFIHKYITKDLDQDKYINIRTLLIQETILYTYSKGVKTPSGIIPKHTPVIILADGSPVYGDGSLCLIKTNASDDLWTGWIEKSALQKDAKEIIDDRRRYNEWNIPVVRNNMSPDNTMLVVRSENWGTSEQNEAKGIAIINNKGDTIVDLRGERFFNDVLFPLRDDQSSQRFIVYSEGGWSDDSRSVWLTFGYSVYGSRFLYIQPYENNFVIFIPPINIHSHFYDFDSNTGDLYYTDFLPSLLEGPRISRTRFDEEVVNSNFKNMFHLFRYNFFTKELVVLREVYGKGFCIRTENNTMMFYEIRRENNENIYEKIEM